MAKKMMVCERAGSGPWRGDKDGKMLCGGCGKRIELRDAFGGPILAFHERKMTEADHRRLRRYKVMVRQRPSYGQVWSRRRGGIKVRVYIAEDIDYDEDDKSLVYGYVAYKIVTPVLDGKDKPGRMRGRCYWIEAANFLRRYKLVSQGIRS